MASMHLAPSLTEHAAQVYLCQTEFPKLGQVLERGSELPRALTYGGYIEVCPECAVRHAIDDHRLDAEAKKSRAAALLAQVASEVAGTTSGADTLATWQTAVRRGLMRWT